MPRKGPHIEEKPLTREQDKFCLLFCRYGDIYKAAERAGIPKSRAVATFHLIQVQEEIERQKDVVRQERARQQVETENLTNRFLDEQLMSVIRDEKGALKKDAIQLGYVVTGRIQAGMTRVLEPAGEGAKSGSPNFYQAFVPVGVAVTSILPEESAETPGASQSPIIEKPADNISQNANPKQQSAQQVAAEPRKGGANYSKTIPVEPPKTTRKAGRLIVE